jgi:hypothetical protein
MRIEERYVRERMARIGAGNQGETLDDLFKEKSS